MDLIVGGGGGVKETSHAVVILWAMNIYWYNGYQGVHWSGATTEVLARPHACPYMGVLANVKATVRHLLP